MTTRDEAEAFRTHRLWALADRVKVLAEDSKGRSTTDRATLARAATVAAYVRSFRAIDAGLFRSNRDSQAENIANQLDSIESQITGWDQEAAMVDSTVAQIDANCNQILAYLDDFGWPSPGRARLDAISSAAESYQAASESSLEGLEEDIAAAEKRLADLRAEVTTLSAEAATRGQEAADSLEALKKTRDSAASQAASNTKNTVKKIEVAASEQRAELEAQAQAILEGLRQASDRADDLLANVSDRAVGGGYLNFAESERRASLRWNALGISAVLLAFGILLIVFVGPLVGDWIKPTTGLENVLLKVGISLSLAAFSVYAFREAGKRLRYSVEARYRSMDVTALPSFSMYLSDEQQKNLRFLMGERLFGSSVESATSKGKVQERNNSFSLSVDPNTVKTVVETVKALKDTVTPTN